jgi:hypothetical protein
MVPLQGCMPKQHSLWHHTLINQSSVFGTKLNEPGADQLGWYHGSAR